MAFLEQRLNARIERGATGGPTNRGRTKVRTAGGKLRQVFTWTAPLHEYEVSHGILTAADFEALRAMWYVVNFTPYEGFRFRDWSDYQATHSNTSLALVTGSDYQLRRDYTFGGVTFSRVISKPNAGVVIQRNRSGVLSTATATVDTTTGLATISGHVSGDTYSWAGTFDIPVTFSDDEWVAMLETNSAGPMPTPPSIKLEEIRL